MSGTGLARVFRVSARLCEQRMIREAFCRCSSHACRGPNRILTEMSKAPVKPSICFNSKSNELTVLLVR